MSEILSQEQQNQLRDQLWEEAYITACEQDSPNSPDFERAREKIYQYLLEEYCNELY